MEIAIEPPDESVLGMQPSIEAHAFLIFAITEAPTQINSRVTHMLVKGAAWVDAANVQPVPAVPGVELGALAVPVLTLGSLSEAAAAHEEKDAPMLFLLQRMSSLFSPAEDDSTLKPLTPRILVYNSELPLCMTASKKLVAEFNDPLEEGLGVDGEDDVHEVGPPESPVHDSHPGQKRVC